MTFPHERLDAFHVALELALGVEHLTANFPTGHADLKDQLRRASSSAMRNIAEGANRWSARDKAARYRVALGECGECDAALLLAAGLHLGEVAELDRLRTLADRVGAMLTALLRRQDDASAHGR